MNTDTSSELRASPPRLQGRRRLPVVAEAPRLRRLQLILLIPTPINGRARCRLCFKVFVVRLRIAQNQEYRTRTVTRTNLRAPEMPTRPAAPEIDGATSCCGRGGAQP